MASKEPLSGIDLVSCAQANAHQGLETVAYHCGYGQDTATFERELQQACQDAGIDYNDLSDLITTQQPASENRGIEISPQNPSTF